MIFCILMSKNLSKSKYMLGLESDALLWLKVNDPSSFPKPGAALECRFEEGFAVESLARTLFNGVDLSGLDFQSNILKTKLTVENRSVIFEAGFLESNLYSRSDVLVPCEDGSWDLFEIKASTKVKDSHIKDLAFQKHVLELSGLKINSCSVILLDRDYVRGDDLDVRRLFKFVDLSDEVDEDIVGIERRIKRMFDVIDLPQCPAFDFHDIPKSEYGNHLIDEFLENEPSDSVFNLYRLGKQKAISLIDEGFPTMSSVPGFIKLSSKQAIQVDVTNSNSVHVDEGSIKDFLGSISYPIYHLDFETFSDAIPKFKNSRAYDQIPFQYSLHIECESGEIEHREFLYEGKGDPRPSFLESLMRDLIGARSILVYYQSFEISRLNELAEYFPEHASWISDAISKIVDLIVPFRNFWYYNPKQRGSCSIKDVLPLFCDKSHQALNIKNGEEASFVYKKNFGSLSSGVKKDLLAYCELDTEGMIYILRGLRSLV